MTDAPDLDASDRFHDERKWEDETITIRMTVRRRWIPHFLSMLKHMQWLGGVGSSRRMSFMADGDGDFRPKFKWDSSLPCDEQPREENDGNRFYDAG